MLDRLMQHGIGVGLSASDKEKLIPGNLKLGVSIDGVVGSFPNIKVGSVFTGYNDTTEVVLGTIEGEWTTFKEIIIGTSGAFRISYTKKAINTTKYSKQISSLFINGSQQGSINTINWSNAYTVITQDLNVNAGDVISLKMYSTGTYNLYCNLFKISYSFDVPERDLNITQIM